MLGTTFGNTQVRSCTFGKGDAKSGLTLVETTESKTRICKALKMKDDNYTHYILGLVRAELRLTAKSSSEKRIEKSE